MNSKIWLFTALVVLLPHTSGCRRFAGESEGWSDEEIGGGHDDAMTKFRELLLLGEATTPGRELIRQELIGSILMTAEICQSGLDEAAFKINGLLQDEERLGYNVLYDDVDDGGDGDDASINMEILQKELPEIFKAEENILVARPAAARDLERIFRTLRHACSSLPSAVPNLGTRRKRSLQKDVERVTSSLTRWTERWVNSLEEKITVFLTDCLNDAHCKAYLENTAERMVWNARQNKNEALKDSSAILEELLQNFPHKASPSMETLSYLQRAALHLGDSGGGLKEEEENAFRMGEKLTKVGGGEESFANQEGNAAEKLVILANLMSLGSTNQRPFEKVPEVEIEMERTVRTIPDTFLSLAIGSRLIRDGWGELQDKFPKFLNLASNLSPSIFRVGGSHANFLEFDPSATHEKRPLGPLNRADSRENVDFDNHVHHHNIHPKLRQSQKPHHPKNKGRAAASFDSYGKGKGGLMEQRCERQLEEGNEFENFTMTKTDWKILVDLNRDLNWTLLWDLNQFQRDSKGAWDPTNAKLLLEDSLTSQIPIIWQLGNEPNAYWHKFNWTVSPEQAAEDYHVLREILNQDISQEAMVVGPDVTRPRHATKLRHKGFMEDSMEFLKAFLKSGAEEIDAVTWHHYYVNGRTTTLDEFLSPETLSVFPKQIHELVSIRDELTPKKEIWLTETASAWGGGAPEISDRFAGAIPWFDKLGAAAIGGVSRVFRQTLYGGCYALLAPDLTPYPGFWVSVLHKHLVGNGVLLARTRLTPNTLRFYAHCLNSKHAMFKKGAVVVLGINLSDFGQKVELANENLRKSVKMLYQFGPPQGNLKSRDVTLNGQVLKANPDGTLPPFIPFMDTQEGLNFAPWSMNFWVFTEAGATACS